MAHRSEQTTLVPFSQPRNKKIRAKKLRVTNLPDDIVEKIFTFLPIKKLCTLSVLSKRFKHTWKSCRDLNFDIDIARKLTRDEYRSVVDNFFNNHSKAACADRLKLYYDATDESTLISFWVGKAIRLGIKELELNLTQIEERITLNYDLVDVETLKILKLVNCDLHLPLSSNGLQHLRELTLQHVMTPPMMTEAIFANCVSLRAMSLIRCSLVYSVKAFAKNLEALTLKDCYDVHSIEVQNCPSLRRFHYHGRMMELRFGCEMPLLSDVILEMAHPRGFHCITRRNEMVARLAFVETFTATSIFLEGLCARFEETEYKKMEFVLEHLKEFRLIVAPESFLNPSDVAIFVNKCPRIERLFIDLGKDALGGSTYWNNYGKSYMTACQATFPFLKYVKIKGFTMKELPIIMARFFLKNAIHLDSLVLVNARIHHFPINYNPENIRWGIISNARIQMCNYRADKDTIMPQHL